MLFDTQKEVSSQWFVIRTKPSKEHFARLQYEQQGFEVYFPVIRKVVRHARQEKTVLRPLFPGYLFLNLLPHQQDWIAISSTRGAIGPVVFGDQYLPLPDGMVEGIQAKEEHGAIPQHNFNAKTFKPGVKVVVDLHGGADSCGVVLSLSGKDNVVVLLDFLNRQVKTTLALAKVKVA